MDRLTYRITNENRRRLELLKAFAVIENSYPTFQDIVNRSIEDYFSAVYEKYCDQSSNDGYLRKKMEELLPG